MGGIYLIFKRKVKLVISFIVFSLTISMLISCNKSKSNYEGKKFDHQNKYQYVEIKSKINDTPTQKYAVSYPYYGKNKVDEEITKFVNDSIDSYKKERRNPQNELNINYEISHLSKQTTSIIFYTDMQRSNKVVHSLKTQTYNLKQKKLLKLKDLFKKKSNYLQKLSDITYRELMKNQQFAKDNNKTKRITEAKEENFQKFVFIGNEIIIYFDNLGIQKVDINTKELKDILKVDYQKFTNNKNLIKEDIANQKNTKQGKKEQFSIDPKKKIVALTFEDGPTPGVTDVILDELKKRKGHATFFVIGNRVEYYPNLLRRIKNEGSEIGNHSWDHQLLTGLSTAIIHEQINKTQGIIRHVVEVDPVHFRPPYNVLNNKVKNATTMTIILKDIDTQDWKYHGKKKIVNYVLENVGDGKIVQMHDSYKTSGEAAVTLIKKLHEKGYQFVTVTELQNVLKNRKHK